MKRVAKYITGAAVFAGCALLSSAIPVYADEALVVGVNHYPGLDGVDLHGCVNDATSVATALKTKYAFQVTTLYDAKATKEGILDAIDHIASTIKPGERFAFYFAGHGTLNSADQAVLLPSDAEESSESNDLGADLLNTRIRAVPAKSRTVILDSCFSGGMVSSKDLRKKTFLTRGFMRPGVDSGSDNKDLYRANRSDTNQNVGGGPSICYFTATRSDEQAGEDEFNGQRHGVFTYYLVPKLDGKGDLWGDIGDAVRSKVASYMDDMQHPTISPEFVGSVAFDNSVGNVSSQNTAGADAPRTVWDLYNSDHVDPSVISITLDPDKSEIGLGDDVSFHAKTGQAGYLVVLERGTSGRCNLLFPYPSSVDGAKVDADSTTDFPGTDQAFKSDAAGSERIKAILFSDAASAKELLDKLSPSTSTDGLSGDEMRSRDLVRVGMSRDAYYTSDITFEVTQ